MIIRNLLKQVASELIHFDLNHRAQDILEEVGTDRNIYKAKFTAALFLVAKNWKK